MGQGFSHLVERVATCGEGAPLLVVIDPISTGLVLAKQASQRGLKVRAHEGCTTEPCVDATVCGVRFSVWGLNPVRSLQRPPAPSPRPPPSEVSHGSVAIAALASPICPPFSLCSR